MNNYLKGYLASIPRSEYDSMVRFLRNNITDKLNISEEQFELLLEQIMAEHQPATITRRSERSEKPSDTYNDFYGNVYIDLNYLFKIVNLLYNTVNGYSNLSSSYLSDIKSEIDKLEVMVNEIKARERYSSNATVVTETFKNTEQFEKYDDSTSYLFCDRDGQQLPLVGLVHNNTNDMITLNVSKNVDLLHAPDGKPIGKLDVIDYRGVPIDTYSVTSNAIDNSLLSFWDCSVLSDEPIDIAMDSFEPGGAYIKFRVRLPAVYEITEVTITPYCIHPVEICDILIGDKSILPVSKVSTDTVAMCSAKNASDEITIILRQKNYTHTIEETNQKMNEAIELWNSVLDKEKESYITSETTKSEDEIYHHYITMKEQQVAIWNDNVIRDRELGE